MTMLTRRAALLSLAIALPLGKPRAQDVTPGKLVPGKPIDRRALTWRDAQGKPHRVADYAGQGIVLNLWATWCGPCVAEMPALAALAQRLQPQRILVIPVSSDIPGAAAITPFFATHHITGLGIWTDEKADLTTAADAPGLPTTLIIDRSGMERARVSGAADWQTLTPRVIALCNA